MIASFLDRAYGARDPEATRALYDDWAASYEAELGENRYVTPTRCAKALAKFLADRSAPVLDFGCGTGLSGLALAASGFDTLDGVDLSRDMLRQAREKGVYRRIEQVDPDAPLPVDLGEYAAITAIGVIGAGAAPIETFDVLMEGLSPGSLLVHSFNDHALVEPANEARINEWLDCGAATLLLRSYGDHIPGKNLKANVYVIEKR